MQTCRNSLREQTKDIHREEKPIHVDKREGEKCDRFDKVEDCHHSDLCEVAVYPMVRLLQDGEEPVGYARPDLPPN